MCVALGDNFFVQQGDMNVEGTVCGHLVHLFAKVVEVADLAYQTLQGPASVTL